MRIILALSFALICGACSHLPGFDAGATDISAAPGVSIHRMPADQRATIVVRTAQSTVTERRTTTSPSGETTTTETTTVTPSRTFVCPQPPGDVAFSRTAENALKLAVEAPADTTGGAIEASFRAAAEAMQLAGRTQSVLLARDMLTYTCVQAANGAISNAEGQSNFNRIAEMLETFARAEQIRAGAEAARAVTNARAQSPDAAVVASLLDNIQATRTTHLQAIVSRVAPNGQFNPALLSNFAAREPVRQIMGGRANNFAQLRDLDALRNFLTIYFNADELSRLSAEAAKP